MLKRLGHFAINLAIIAVGWAIGNILVATDLMSEPNLFYVGIFTGAILIGIHDMISESYG